MHIISFRNFVYFVILIVNPKFLPEFNPFKMLKLSIIPFIFFLFLIQTSFANRLDSLRLEKKDGKNYVIHQVSKGQTLFGTLRKYGTTLSEFREANPGVNADIRINQILRIPYFKAIKEKTKNAAKLTVKFETGVSAKPNETGFQTIDSLILVVENEKVMNFEKYFVVPPKVAVVESGNTLFKIAKKTGSTVAEIKKLNNLSSDLIEIGQVLMVKDGVALKGKTKPIIDFEENIAIKRFKETEAIQAAIAAETDNVIVPQNETIVVQKELVIVAEKPAQKIEEKKPVDEKKVDIVKKSEAAPIKPILKDTLPVNKPVIAKTQPILTADDVENNSPRTVKIEEGIAEIIEVESKSGKYLALHKSAPLGTLVQVRNETNGASVWVKVIGRLPEVDQNENIIIKLSPKAMARVSPVDKRFRAKINYSL